MDFMQGQQECCQEQEYEAWPQADDQWLYEAVKVGVGVVVLVGFGGACYWLASFL